MPWFLLLGRDSFRNFPSNTQRDDLFVIPPAIPNLGIEHASDDVSGGIFKDVQGREHLLGH
jgi:hypothetical protein